MQSFFDGFEKVASKADILKALAAGGDSSKNILKSLGQISGEMGTMAGHATESAGKLIGAGGQAMQKYPGVVLPAAAGTYLAAKILGREAPRETSYYANPYSSYA